MRIFLLVVLAVMLTATPTLADTPVGEGTVQSSGSSQEEEQRIGTVGEVYTPPDDGQAASTPPPAPEWQTLGGCEKATQRVLRGDFAPKWHTHRAPVVRAVVRTRIVEKPVVRVVRVVEKKVPTPAPKPVVVNNFVTPPGEAAPSPADAGERKNRMDSGWIVLGIVLIAAIVGVVAIITANQKNLAEQATRQGQTNQLAVALGNQAPFAPAQGRKVSINASIFPNGGGVIRADSDDKPVVVPANSWVITPGPVAPAPQGQGQAIDPNTQAEAGAGAQ